MTHNRKPSAPTANHQFYNQWGQTRLNINWNFGKTNKTNRYSSFESQIKEMIWSLTKTKRCRYDRDSRETSGEENETNLKEQLKVEKLPLKWISNDIILHSHIWISYLGYNYRIFQYNCIKYVFYNYSRVWVHGLLLGYNCVYFNFYFLTDLIKHTASHTLLM